MDGAGDDDNEDGVNFATTGANNLSGTALVKDPLVNGHQENGLYVSNSSGSLSLTVDNTDFSNSVREDGVLLETFGRATLTALVKDGAFSGLASDGVRANANAGVLNITAQTNTFTGCSSSCFSDPSDNAISFVSAGSATMRVNIASNTMNNSHNSAIILGANGTSLYHGRVTGNTITNTTNGNGIDGALAAADDATTTLFVDGNTISGQRQGAALFKANNTGELDLTFTNNTMNTRPTDTTAFETLNVSANDTGTVCADIRTNTLARGGTNAGNIGFDADSTFLDDDPTSTVSLERGSSASNDPATVYLANNPNANGVTISEVITLVANGTCQDPATVPVP